jgi:general stress protein 26
VSHGALETRGGGRMTGSSGELLGQRALEVVSRAQLGLMMTCDPEGRPHGRWMHVYPVQGLLALYALTGEGSRKTEHIALNPHVAWLFASAGFETVVQLKGTAAVHRDFAEAHEVWDRLAAAARQYVIGPLSDEAHLSLVTIMTTVEHAEITCPDLGAPVPRTIRLGG